MEQIYNEFSSKSQNHNNKRRKLNYEIESLEMCSLWCNKSCLHTKI